jgi:hypothetical protein
VTPLPPSAFSLKLIGSPLNDAAPRSEILLNGERTGKTLDGAILEAALRWKKLILVFVTDAVLYEDTLHIYLLDTNLQVLDQASMYGLYATGTFSLLDIVPPDSVRFVFFGETVWRLKISDHKTLRLPIMSDPHGVRRPFGFYRQFSLQSERRPEQAQ